MTGRQIRFLALPALALVGLLGLWEAVVRINQIQPFVLPAPSLIATTFMKDAARLAGPALGTLSSACAALAAAAVAGGLLALALARFRGIAEAFLPFALILQATPFLAVALLATSWVVPILLIYFGARESILACAFVIAFLPILANTALGLTLVDPRLLDLFRAYRASPGRQWLWLRAPSALPHFLRGLRLAGWLALIETGLAEVAAKSGPASSNLGVFILEQAYRLNTPRVFAALALFLLLGVALYGALWLLGYLLLRRWPDGASDGAGGWRRALREAPAS